ncbi:MAG: hypothetical protein KJ868_06855, partial [Gammaproteobacteria bacterium]|nr:hypothetical protein [Gammaproteobacteria bacterium]
MIKRLSSVSLLALSISTIAIASENHDGSMTRYRVFIGDHATPQVTALDLDNPDKRWTFNTAGQSKLYSVSNNDLIVAVQSDNDQVN